MRKTTGRACVFSVGCVKLFIRHAQPARCITRSPWKPCSILRVGKPSATIHFSRQLSVVCIILPSSPYIEVAVTHSMNSFHR